MAYAKGIDVVMARTLAKDSKGKAVMEAHKMSDVDEMENARGNFVCVLVENPKKPGSIADTAWGLYGRIGAPTVTVGAYMKNYPTGGEYGAGGKNRARTSLLWDWNRRYIAIVTNRNGVWYEVNKTRNDCQLPVATSVATVTAKSVEETALAI